MAGSEAFQRMREATEKALQLDPSLAEAHVVGELVRGLIESRRTVELDPLVARSELRSSS